MQYSKLHTVQLGLGLVILFGELPLKGRATGAFVPAAFHYDENGNVIVESPEQQIANAMAHNYRETGPEFNKRRILDHEATLFATFIEKKAKVTFEDGMMHPIAAAIASGTIRLVPQEDLQKKFDRMRFDKRGPYKAGILDKVAKTLEKLGLPIDLQSVAKHKVGELVYLADDDGVARIPRSLALGMGVSVPRNRLAREVGSLKSAERFSNPVRWCEVSEIMAPYVTTLRVAVLHDCENMLDGMDLGMSAAPKVASRLERDRIVDDVESVPAEFRNLEYAPSAGALRLIHRELEVWDENEKGIGPMRLVFPGGVKVCASPRPEAFWCGDVPVDGLLDIRTVADKGAVGLLAAMSPDWRPDMDKEESFALVQNLPTYRIEAYGEIFEGYMGEIPCYRSGQRHTEWCKATQGISWDLVAHAMFNQDVRVSPMREEEYDNFRSVLNGLARELQSST